MTVSRIRMLATLSGGVLAYLILNETITVATGFGAVLVLAGIYVASYAEQP